MAIGGALSDPPVSEKQKVSKGGATWGQRQSFHQESKPNSPQAKDSEAWEHTDLGCVHRHGCTKYLSCPQAWRGPQGHRHTHLPHFLLPGLFESNCRRVFWVSLEGCGGVSQLLREAPSSKEKLCHLLGELPLAYVPVHGSIPALLPWCWTHTETWAGRLRGGNSSDTLLLQWWCRLAGPVACAPSFPPRRLGPRPGQFPGVVLRPSGRCCS